MRIRFSFIKSTNLTNCLGVANQFPNEASTGGEDDLTTTGSVGVVGGANGANNGGSGRKGTKVGIASISKCSPK